jgi:ubiquinone/menaquinone biosynthesis C-methylase UbiE
VNRKDFDDLFKFETDLWWFAGMRRITESVLNSELNTARRRTILDAGCGTGANLEFLERYSAGGTIVGVDLSRDALEYCRERTTHPTAQASAEHLPFASESFDLVTSFDVIVQIPGEGADVQSLNEIYRVLNPGGAGFIRVAAYEWMRAGHDAAMLTQRRFTLSELRSKLEGCGFEVRRATYANSILFPVAAAKRLVLEPLRLADRGSDVRPFPRGLRWLDPIFRRLMYLEAALLKLRNFRSPAGLSVICLVRKPPS